MRSDILWTAAADIERAELSVQSKRANTSKYVIFEHGPAVACAFSRRTLQLMVQKLWLLRLLIKEQISIRDNAGIP